MYYNINLTQHDQYISLSPGDLLKSQVGEKSDAQKDGGYTTTKIGDHCQNLTVSFTDRGSGHILKYTYRTKCIFKASICSTFKCPILVTPL